MNHPPLIVRWELEQRLEQPGEVSRRCCCATLNFRNCRRLICFHGCLPIANSSRRVCLVLQLDRWLIWNTSGGCCWCRSCLMEIQMKVLWCSDLARLIILNNEGEINEFSRSPFTSQGQYETICYFEMKNWRNEIAPGLFRTTRLNQITVESRHFSTNDQNAK